MPIALWIMWTAGGVLETVLLGKLLNSCDEYWGPLSLTTSSGMPNLAKRDLSAEITPEDVMHVSMVALKVSPQCQVLIEVLSPQVAVSPSGLFICTA